jgi:cytochrome oxidase Cu insertion factor (SCO1/SenC/PrrC family)
MAKAELKAKWKSGEMRIPKEILTTLLLLLVPLSGCIGGSEVEEPTFHGTKWMGTEYAPLFTLESMDENLWSLEEQRGKTVILAFTYTRCYNTCPVISASLDMVYESLNTSERENVSLVSVTIDPWHDSPSHLRNWTTDRGYDWPHLTGHQDAVLPVLETYGVGPINFDDDSEEGYGFSHTQPTYIIDAEGRPRVVWSDAEIPVDLFLQDLRIVLNRS